jgi:hypothetical protein
LRPRPPSVLGGRSTVGHGALDAVIGVRIPASQPAFARLRRATARLTPYLCEPREGCRAEAAQPRRRAARQARRADSSIAFAHRAEAARREGGRLGRPVGEGWPIAVSAYAALGRQKTLALSMNSEWPKTCFGHVRCRASANGFSTSSEVHRIPNVTTSASRAMLMSACAGTTTGPRDPRCHIDRGQFCSRWSFAPKRTRSDSSDT